MLDRDQFQLIKLIQKLEIFCDLSSEEALILLQMCQQRSFDAVEVIWCPGDPGEDVLLPAKRYAARHRSRSQTHRRSTTGCLFWRNGVFVGQFALCRFPGRRTLYRPFAIAQILAQPDRQQANPLCKNPRNDDQSTGPPSQPHARRSRRGRPPCTGRAQPLVIFV